MADREPYLHAIGRLRAMPDYEKTSTDDFAREYIHQGRIVELWKAAGDPQRAYPVIVAAGSNGKGSISAMTANILTRAGYRVGLWTKPHFHTHRERIRVVGEMVGEESFACLFDAVAASVAATSLRSTSRYEFMVTMALEHFRRAAVDVAVLEGGAGGYIDLLSAIEELSVVYGSITMEHAALLGDTIGAIAREKSGLIKHGCVAVAQSQAADAMRELREAAASRDAALYVIGEDVLVERAPGTGAAPQSAALEYVHPDVRAAVGVASHTAPVALRGRYQLLNAAAAATTAALFGRGRRPVGPGAIEAGLGTVEWPARLELAEIGGRRFLLDSAHNAGKIETLVQALDEDFSYGRLVAVIGISWDKDAAAMLTSIASRADVLIVTQSTHPRRTLASDLASIAASLGIACEACGDVNSAIARARELTGPEDLICVSGSMFVVMEAQVAAGFVAETEPSW